MKKTAPAAGPRPGFLRQAVKSITQRYPRELVSDLRRGSVHSHGADRFRARWEEACANSSRPVAAWLGHCTVLLRLGGVTILTDPVLSSKIGVGIGPVTLGVRRTGNPPVLPAHLPPVDLVLLSHPHFDHLDKPTLKALVRRQTLVLTARNTRRLIPRGFGPVTELDWDEAVDLGGLHFRAIRPAHWGARTAWDRHRGYNSYVIDAPGGRVLFAGDTAHTGAYSGLDGVDLAVFGIGAYDPWIHHHASPEQVWSMFTGLGGRYLMPVHHSTFKLSSEPVDEPMQRLLRAAGPHTGRVVVAGPGDVFSLDQLAARDSA